MNTIYKQILTLLALLAILPAMAQVSNADIETTKTISGPNANGIYTLTLEQYVKAKALTTSSEERVPDDIVLVLDVSASMAKKCYICRVQDVHFNPDTLDHIRGAGEGYYVFNVGSQLEYNPTLDYSMKWDSNQGWMYKTKFGSTWQTIAYAYNNYTWTRNFYVYISRINHLKSMAIRFIDAVYEDAKTNHLNHRISIITFSGSGSISKPFTPIGTNDTALNDANVESLKNIIEGLSTSGSTRTDDALQKAMDVLDTARPQQSTRTVLFFTDGHPFTNTNDNYNQNADIDATIANNTIRKAYTLKNSYKASLYSIVMNVPNVYESSFLDYTSSNYPFATDRNTSGGGDSMAGYYQSIGSAADLYGYIDSVVAQITTQDPVITLNGTTVAKDIITKSFRIPAGANRVRLYTSNATVGTDGTVTWATRVPAVNATAQIDDSQGDGTTVVTVTNYDYSTHWVGRFDPPSPRKLIIEIDIEPKPNAVGGVNIPTNKGESGIYFENALYENYTPIPTVTLPVNITIRKTGLEADESATFKISKNTNPNYPGGPTEAPTWTYFTTVILTGTGDAANPPVVKLVKLAPEIYQIEESEWSWTYDPTSATVVTTEHATNNLFEFSNAKKTTVPARNAEAVVKNVFNP
jgi:uncharacterized protein YegL